MSHTIVTYTVKPGREEENVVLVRGVFEQLAAERPAGFRYAVFHSAESGEFTHLYTDEGAAPGTLQQLPAFQAFLSGAYDRHAQPATFKEFELVGAYRTFDDQSPGTSDDGSISATTAAAGETRSAQPTQKRDR